MVVTPIMILGLATAVAAVDPGHCALYMSETLANPVGAQTCKPDGLPGVSKGTQCMKMNVGNGALISQQCDYTPGVDSICASFKAVAGQCCTTTTKAKIVCAGTASGFDVAPSKTDFSNCPPCGSTAPPPPVDPVPSPTPSVTNAPPTVAEVFEFLLSFTGVDNPSALLSNDAVKAIIKAVAAALSVIEGHVHVTKVAVEGGESFTPGSSTSGDKRRLADGKVRVDVKIDNADGKVTDETFKAALPELKKKTNDALADSGVNAKVGDVAGDASNVASPSPSPAAVTVSNPCAPVATQPTTTQAPTPAPTTTSFVNPCVVATTAAPRLVLDEAGVAEKATMLQRAGSGPTSLVFGMLALVTSVAVLGFVVRSVKRSRRATSVSFAQMRLTEDAAEDSAGDEEFSAGVE